MSIHPGILNNYGAKHVIVLKGTQTLNNAIQQLQENKSSENETYLVVEQGVTQYRVIRFSDLGAVVGKMGPDCLIQPLAALPLPPATRVERQDTPESGKAIGDWVRTTPRARLVVIDDTGVVGLLVNTDMSGGVFDRILFSVLHGEEANLGKDYREAIQSQAGADPCPHCKEKIFCKYDVARNVYICPKCNGVV